MTPREAPKALGGGSRQAGALYVAQGQGGSNETSKSRVTETLPVQNNGGSGTKWKKDHLSIELRQWSGVNAAGGKKGDARERKRLHQCPDKGEKGDLGTVNLMVLRFFLRDPSSVTCREESRVTLGQAARGEVERSPNQREREVCKVDNDNCQV